MQENQGLKIKVSINLQMYFCHKHNSGHVYVLLTKLYQAIITRRQRQIWLCGRANFRTIFISNNLTPTHLKHLSTRLMVVRYLHISVIEKQSCGHNPYTNSLQSRLNIPNKIRPHQFLFTFIHLSFQYKLNIQIFKSYYNCSDQWPHNCSLQK